MRTTASHLRSRLRLSETRQVEGEEALAVADLRRK